MSRTPAVGRYARVIAMPIRGRSASSRKTMYIGESLGWNLLLKLCRDRNPYTGSNVAPSVSRNFSMVVSAVGSASDLASGAPDSETYNAPCSLTYRQDDAIRHSMVARN